MISKRETFMEWYVDNILLILSIILIVVGIIVLIEHIYCYLVNKSQSARKIEKAGDINVITKNEIYEGEMELTVFGINKVLVIFTGNYVIFKYLNAINILNIKLKVYSNNGFFNKKYNALVIPQNILEPVIVINAYDKENDKTEIIIFRLKRVLLR